MNFVARMTRSKIRGWPSGHGFRSVGSKLPSQPKQAKLRCRHNHGNSPVGRAEHRRKLRGSRRGLFERLQAASSAAAAGFEKRRLPQSLVALPLSEGRAVGSTRSAAEGVTSGSPSLGYLSWRDKKGTVPAGHPRHPNQLRVSAPNPIAFGYPSTESRISLHSIRATTASWVSLRSTQPTAVFAISQPHHCRRRQA